jgi:hypothetical protein
MHATCPAHFILLFIFGEIILQLPYRVCGLRRKSYGLISWHPVLVAEIIGRVGALEITDNQAPRDKSVSCAKKTM